MSDRDEVAAITSRRVGLATAPVVAPSAALSDRRPNSVDGGGAAAQVSRASRTTAALYGPKRFVHNMRLAMLTAPAIAVVLAFGGKTFVRSSCSAVGCGARVCLFCGAAGSARARSHHSVTLMRTLTHMRTHHTHMNAHARTRTPARRLTSLCVVAGLSVLLADYINDDLSLSLAVLGAFGVGLTLVIQGLHLVELSLTASFLLWSLMVFVLLLGLWFVLTHAWTSRRNSTYLAVMAERALFTMLPFCTNSILGWATLGLAGPLAPFYLVVVFALPLFTVIGPIPSSFLLDFADAPRIELASRFVLGPRSAALYCVSYAVLPSAVHVALQPAWLDAFTFEGLLTSTLLVFACLAVLFFGDSLAGCLWWTQANPVPLSLASSARAWLEAPVRWQRIAAEIAIVYPLLAALEHRVLLRMARPYLALESPWGELGLTCFLYSAVAGGHISWHCGRPIGARAGLQDGPAGRQLVSRSTAAVLYALMLVLALSFTSIFGLSNVALVATLVCGMAFVAHFVSGSLAVFGVSASCVMIIVAEFCSRNLLPSGLYVNERATVGVCWCWFCCWCSLWLLLLFL